jgi:hypothetical protein
MRLADGAGKMFPVAAADPYELIGEWKLLRRMVDRRAGLRGRMHGTLSVAVDEQGFSWLEQGTLDWDGQVLPVHRQLYVRQLDGQWWTTFADGRPFHVFDPGRPVIHPCRADTYSGVLDVDPGVGVLRTLWDVTGPYKAQRIFTRCARIAS